MLGKPRLTAAVALFAVALAALSAARAQARVTAFSGSYSFFESDLYEWPSDLFGVNGYVAPFGRNLYLVPGAAAARDSDDDLTSAGFSLNLHYMLPAGDRFIPFLEAGLVGAVFRLDVLDRTGAGPEPSKDRTTYLRGGFQVGAGVDIAIGGSWSVVAALRSVRLGEVETERVLREGRVVGIEENPSYWELPRLAIVYWY